MNKNKQSGKISKFMLMVIIGGIGYGAYIAKSKGIITKDSISQIGNKISSFASPSTSDYTGYGIQLMATKQFKQATALMNDFANDGYSAFVIKSQAKGRTLYKVRLGPYLHKPEAVAVKDKVVRRYPGNPYVKSSLIIYKP